MLAVAETILTPAPRPPLTRGERVIAFIEKYCIVPEGTLMGKPVRLAAFQKDFILAVYDNPEVTDTAILSIARKNAKTALIAFIVIAHLIGPVALQNSRILSGGMSKEQASEVFNYAAKCIRLSHRLSSLIRIKESVKEMIGIRMNVIYKAISADAKTAHGKSPIVAILDEVGQIRGPTSDFVSAIETAQGAYEAQGEIQPLIFYISTQAESDSDFFSILIDDARDMTPPKTVCHVYEADEDCDVMDEAQWYKSNPGLGDFRSMSDMRKLAEKAARMPSFGNTFRNLNLNQRVETFDPLFSRDDWKACGKAPHPLAECSKIYGGLDLSGTTALTALELIGWHDESETWNAHSFFWTPEKGLLARSKEDKVPYDRWHGKGLIKTTPGKTVNYSFVVKDMIEIVKPIQDKLEAIAFDRWRMEQLKKECDNFSDAPDFKFEEWGQGFKDMAPAIDAIEDFVLNETIRHGNNPVLTSCMSNSLVIKDPADNRKLDKRHARRRIDGMQALAMAAGIAVRKDEGGDLDDFINNPISS